MRLMALMGIQGVCPSKNLSYSGIKHRKISLSFKGNGYLISQSSVGNRYHLLNILVKSDTGSGFKRTPVLVFNGQQKLF